MRYPYFAHIPAISPEAFIAPSSVIIGNVTIGRLSGIWFHCVLRGDVQSITVGDETNIQDGTIIHVTRNTGPTTIGSRVTIGHKALLHACTIQDRSFIGMGAILMDGVVVESGGMVAAGALMTPGKRVRTGEIWAGNPGKLFRNLTKEESDFIEISADNYVQHAKEYLSLLSSASSYTSHGEK